MDSLFSDQNMLRFLRRLLFSTHPLDPENLGEKTRDVAFRVMEDNDIETCLSFYRANEAAHFPPGHFDHYAKALRSRNFLTLIATRDGRSVGCCGIYYAKSTEGLPIGYFCYGMVDPDHQRTGIGTAQLLVRIAMLPVIKEKDLAIAAMTAVPNSVSFYRRFGFDFTHEVTADDGGTYPLGLLKTSPSFIEDCQRVLAHRDITCPDVRDRIPFRDGP